MISEHKFIKMRDDVELHAEIREVGSQVWFIATHGIGEHLGRHSYIPDLFASDFNIIQYDLRGHGRSMGEAAHIVDFEDYQKDLGEIINYLKKKYKMDRYILFAHSMGALITAGYLENHVEEDLYPERIFLNAPPVGYTGPLGKVVKYSPRSIFATLASIPQSVKLGGLVDLNYLSHDPKTKEEYEGDDLNALKLHTKLLLEMVKSSGIVFSKPIRPKCPAFVTVGSEDMIVSVPELVHYFDIIEKGFKVRVIEGAYHEIHNEIEKFRLPYFEYLKECLIDCVYSEPLD